MTESISQPNLPPFAGIKSGPKLPTPLDPFIMQNMKRPQKANGMITDLTVNIKRILWGRMASPGPVRIQNRIVPARTLVEIPWLVGMVFSTLVPVSVSKSGNATLYTSTPTVMTKYAPQNNVYKESALIDQHTSPNHSNNESDSDATERLGNLLETPSAFHVDLRKVCTPHTPLHSTIHREAHMVRSCWTWIGGYSNSTQKVRNKYTNQS